MVAGGALLLLANIIPQTTTVGKTFSKALKGIGVALLAFGAILKVVEFAVKAFSATTAAALMSNPITAILAGIAAAAVALFTVFRGETKAEKLERLNEEA
jgi:hypothetical protein